MSNTKGNTGTLPTLFTQNGRQEVKVGDIVLTARASRYGDTTFNKVLVTGRTAALLKVQPYHERGDTLEDVEVFARSNKHSARRNGFRMEPWNVYKLESSGITEAEIEAALKKGAETEDPLFTF